MKTILGKKNLMHVIILFYFFANLYIMVTKKNLLQIGQSYSLGKKMQKSPY
jgi:hypothetical protein